MKLRRMIVIPACAIAVGLSGCGEVTSGCPTETPKVEAFATSGCTATPGSTVTVPLRLCPTCNQTGASCDVDLSEASSGDIFLDPVVEACESANSCPPTCDQNAINCSFAAPPPGSYRLVVFDPASDSTIVTTLQVVQSGPTSCAL
jgi:hypothetical protein